ncbi:YigZ family protein [Fulvivirga kasyanovii]|uniref:YigZ family protein n=1 Tax=Fulvivirga kasyanovii TaxID=396812 RepID=A0ABW9RTM3_9BACT|nr:YigZ family protein [Fulvivirga kasyanovii]MTI27549.1 YigZ family protein [Fulvivirga kasyanovii]
MSKKAESYLTISAPAEGLYKEKGSKFLAFAYPVTSEDDIKDRLDELRKKYYDARHHCYAYVLGADREVYRANDDGEPNHSAGDPILGQINSKQLTNTLVVVVRYFGGTKLGVSGLINAYKVSTEEALNNVQVKKIDITRTINLRYSYDTTNEVMRLINDFEVKITDQVFEADCQLTGEIKIGMTDQLEEKVTLLIDTGHEVSLEYSDD